MFLLSYLPHVGGALGRDSQSRPVFFQDVYMR